MTCSLTVSYPDWLVAISLLLVAGRMANAFRAKICTTEAVAYTCMIRCIDTLHLKPRYCLPNLLYLPADCSQVCPRLHGSSSYFASTQLHRQDLVLTDVSSCL